jgi:hypothetical protein
VAQPKNIDPVARAAFNAVERARRDLAANAGDDFSNLYQIVPFVIADISTDTYICIALKGPIAAKVPPHWDYDATSPLFTFEEHKVLGDIAHRVAFFLEAVGITPQIGFEAQMRIDKVGSFAYFR